MSFEIPIVDQEHRDQARTFEKYEGQYIRHQVALMRDFLVANSNKVEQDWIDDGYSEIYVSVILDSNFSTHPRLQGNIDNITYEDIKHYAVYSKLLDH